MPVEVVMPKLGLTMASGTIARWIKQPGEAVRAGEPLVEVSTDKINYEVESPASGTLAHTAGTDGEEFDCGAVIGIIALEGDGSIGPLVATTSSAPAATPAARASSPSTAPPTNGARTIASPAARKLARERGVTL